MIGKFLAILAFVFIFTVLPILVVRYGKRKQ